MEKAMKNNISVMNMCAEKISEITKKINERGEIPWYKKSMNREDLSGQLEYYSAVFNRIEKENKLLSTFQ